MFRAADHSGVRSPHGQLSTRYGEARSDVVHIRVKCRAACRGPGDDSRTASRKEGRTFGRLACVEHPQCGQNPNRLAATLSSKFYPENVHPLPTPAQRPDSLRQARRTGAPAELARLLFLAAQLTVPSHLGRSPQQTVEKNTKNGHPCRRARGHLAHASRVLVRRRCALLREVQVEAVSGVQGTGGVGVQYDRVSLAEVDGVILRKTSGKNKFRRT